MRSVNRTRETAFSVGILAGGKSSRMGKNKALLKFENTTVIQRTAGEFADVSDIYISAASAGEYEFIGIPVVYDENADIGPIEGIRRVLSAAQNEYVFICAADMPFISRDIARYLTQFICSDYDCYVITDDEHMHPLCAVYSKRVLPVIEELIAEGKYRLREIFALCPTKYVPIDLSCCDRKVVRNINTKEEYNEAVKPFVFCVCGYSDSGKTWLISMLINEFIRDGYSTAVLKHDGHDVFTDAKGSDTYIAEQAGAKATAVFSDTRYCVTLPGKLSPEGFANMLRDADDTPDVLIIEGMKTSVYPKVEIIRKSVYDKSVCDSDTLICAASDCISPRELSCPVFGLDDVRGIYKCVKDHFEMK